MAALRRSRRLQARQQEIEEEPMDFEPEGSAISMVKQQTRTELLTKKSSQKTVVNVSNPYPKPPQFSTKRPQNKVNAVSCRFHM